MRAIVFQLTGCSCWLMACCLTATEPSISRYNEAYPEAGSKKGLQVEMVDDAIALGIKHAGLNLDLCRVVDLQAAADSLSWEVDGRAFHFHRGYVERMDREVKTLSDHGILINIILLTYLSNDPAVNALMIHPNCVQQPPNRLGAFNSRTEEGRLWLNATLQFLSERWSRPDRSCGRAVGWVVGNEVNSHWWWSNMGEVTMQSFADDYQSAVRLVHSAVRSQSSCARVYVSLEHHWTMRYPPANAKQAFAGREFLDYFAAKVRDGGDFDWHVAFHPYPEDLFEPRFWNDKSALESSNTPRITFKNLGVLTEYMQRAELQFDGRPRRIIFSEQGFHTPDGPQGEAVQAAAFCYAYKKIEKLNGVDAFILHRHVDHPHEGGLRLGLRKFLPQEADPRPKKWIYNCFKEADTDQWEAAFQFALPIIGLPSWDEA
jgi:hypothetical protein